jgi:hypothetical protein
MNAELKRRIAFAVLMGIITTGIISFVIIAINLGVGGDFVDIWLRSWAIGYVIVIPAILLIGPWLQTRIDQVIK